MLNAVWSIWICHNRTPSWTFNWPTKKAAGHILSVFSVYGRK